MSRSLQDAEAKPSRENKARGGGGQTVADVEHTGQPSTWTTQMSTTQQSGKCGTIEEEGIRLQEEGRDMEAEVEMG
jgi:hypothetical protein